MRKHIRTGTSFADTADASAMILAHFNIPSSRIPAIRDQTSHSSSIRTKYVRTFPNQLQKNINRALSLGLHQNGRKRILDIGSGCCFFPAVAQYFGHSVVATDVDLHAPIFTDVRALFDQSLQLLSVQAFKPLPEHFASFDMVTGFATCFNIFDVGDGGTKHWGVPEWMFFVSDVRDRLTPEGVMVFDINKDPDAAFGMAPELVEAFTALDGTELCDIGGYFRLKVANR